MDLIDGLHEVRPVARSLWRALADGEDRDSIGLRIHTRRLLVDDRDTVQLAVLIIVTLMVHMGIRPTARIMYTFDILGAGDELVDVETAPPQLVARARMLAACANGEFEAAAAVFRAYAAVRPWDVTDFLTEAALQVVKESRR